MKKDSVELQTHSNPEDALKKIMDHYDLMHENLRKKINKRPSVKRKSLAEINPLDTPPEKTV
jgi:hypothetical protein